MKRPIYLDYNATTPHDPEVIAAMRPFLDEEFGNPTSGHLYGTAPRQAVERARCQVARLINCRPDEVLFTSGGTESNNHAIRGMAAALRGRGRHIVTSAIEHPAVLEVCRALQRAGFDITRLPVDGDGLVDPRAVERALGPGTLMVSIMHANNETGALQPIEEIARICRAHGVVLHTDAAQSLGKVPVDVQRLGVDLLSIAGHKLYAPKGVGALFIRSPLAPEPLLYGAGQEMGRRAGTQNVLLIAGLGAACEIAGRDLPRCMETMCRLRDRMQALLLDDAAPARVNGPLAARLPNTLSISFRDLEAGRILEEIGPEVAASAGAACHAGTLAVSHVLEAMGLPPEWAQGTLRLSLGRPSREEQIERAAAVVGDAVRRLRKRS